MSLNLTQRPAWLRCAIAVFAVALAAAVRVGLLGVLGTRSPFITFYPAVIFAALGGGLPGGLLATALSALVAGYAWMEPAGRFSVQDPADWLSLGFFVTVCAIVSWVVHAMRRARERAGEAALRDEGGEAAGLGQDIATREEAEESLRESEAQFQTLANAIPQLCWMANADGWLFWYNQRWYEYTGATPEQMKGWGWQSVHDPAELPRVIERWKASIATGEPFDMVFPLRGADGVFRPFLTRVMPVRGRDGRVARWFGTNTDISQQRATEQALREERERLRLALGASHAGVWEWDLRTNANIWSDELWTLYGLEPHSCEPSYEAWLKVVHPEDRLLAGRTLQEAARNGAEMNLEFRVPRAGGATLWLMLLGRPFGDADGNVARYIGIAVDITRRKAVEDELLQSGERLRLAQTRGSVGVWDWNRRTGDLHFTPELEQLYGLSPGSIRTYGDWRRLAHPDDIVTLEAERDAAIAGHAPFDLEFRILHVSGETRWLSARGGALYDDAGEAVRVLGVNVDITQRKRAEEALADAMQRLNAHMDNSPLAVIEFDPQFRVVRWSKEAENVFGWTAEEIQGRAISDVPWVYEDDAESVARVSQDMLHGKSPRNSGTNRNYRKDGSVVECEWYNSAIYDAEGKLTSILSQVLDVTDRKLAEDRLRQAQKFESLGLLAGGVAHDFNNLLVGVIGNASLAKELLPPDNPASELLDGVIHTGEQAAHLTRQMLAYSGKGKFLVEPLNLSALIPEMTGLVRPSISKKIALRLELDADLPPIEADRGQVQQVFMNLTLNASEAIGSHAGMITVSTGSRSVDNDYLRLHRDAADLHPGEYVFLEVRDTGCGMDAATVAKIFDPFFSTKFTGRGLGLAAVAGIVRGHKGVISVSSAPGKGSCFTVLFPAGARVPVEAPAPAVRDALAAAGAILVVDDEDVVRTMVKKALERQGYEVLAAESGRTAVDILKRHTGRIAAVILDLSMPGMSGEETLPELRRIRPEIKVLISSGYSEVEAMRLFQGQRVSGFLQKPYTSRGIADKLRTCLS